MTWESRVPASLADEYDSAMAGDDVTHQLEVMQRIVAEVPDAKAIWYDLAMWFKWLRRWPESRAAGQQALALLEDTSGSPEAWNLGIAATALGDWTTARSAWRAFGMDVPGEDGEPILVHFGLAPVRLNPEPRFHEPELLIDGRRHHTEVVWGRRLCPARVRIENVPTPESGHRHGDVVLHDGDPVGERRMGDGMVGVFNEIAVLERSPVATLVTEVTADRAAVDALVEEFFDSGHAAECWSTNVQPLCRACSEGSPDGHHDHRPAEPSRELLRSSVGIAAPRALAERVLDDWTQAGPGRDRSPLTSVEA